jgi:hypothetical protein
MADEDTGPQVAQDPVEPRWSVHWQKRHAAPVVLNGVTVTPEARALVVRLPFGGFVWNHPAALLVERAGQTERVVIGDVTLMAQIAILMLTAVALVVSGLWFSSKRPG